MTLTTSTSMSNLFNAYLKMPVMFVLQPVEQNNILKFAYYKGLIDKDKEVEKICDYFTNEWLPLRTELIYHRERLAKVRPYKVPSLYELQLVDYNRYMSKMHQQPYRLYQQGNYVGVTHFIG